MARTVVVGNAGQDGTYLTRLLHAHGSDVVGIDPHGRRGEADVVYASDLANERATRDILAQVRPSEIYYLAAFHHSSEQPLIETGDLISKSMETNALAVNRTLNALAATVPEARFLYASSSRVFGEAKVPMQNEDTPFAPVDPYGISKASGMEICRYWRRARGVFASAAILYNHESPLRRPTFISQKIVRAAVDASRGTLQTFKVGNVHASVDWGHAEDTVRAMWLILQQLECTEYVVATGQMHTVKDWLDEAFGLLGLNWPDHVIEDRSVLSNRQPPVSLRGDATRLRNATGWRPEISFQALVRDMVESEIMRRGADVRLENTRSSS